MTAPQVLVVGAGPTGLTAACALLQHGVPVRLVDRRECFAAEPKALVMWSGALEALHRLGVADAVAERALPLTGASYWSNGRRLAGVSFGTLTGTRFPGPLCVPQPVTEELLYERLLGLGGRVEWATRATSVEAAGDRAVVRLESAGGAVETVAVPWLIGADGVRSTVREALGIPYEGSSYDREFVLGDGRIAGDLPPTEAQYHLSPDGVLVLVALPEGGHRIFFDLPPGSRTGPPDNAELQQLLDARGRGRWTVEETWWTSRFRVHTKVAATFRQGPVFLAGDAAHAHSPAGGQGLNTGVQDGFDLGWKLAAVLRGGDPALLDSYDPERRPTSARAVRNSERQTRLWLLKPRPARALRDLLLGALSRSGALERRIVPELAQLDLDLTASPAVGRTPAPGGPTPGRRLGDAPLRPMGGTGATSLHGYLATGRHTVLVAGAGQEAATAAEEAATELTRRGVRDLADVLLLLPPDGPVPVPAGPSGHDLAAGRLPGGQAGAAALACHLRPDGVVARVVTLDRPGRVGELLSALPTGQRSATPAP
ncbi:FAD-dependent monooxygenase [Kitasatospora sp. NPDC058032]|uniref:FAD-dependent monooxygenase n=1 Tax=unclassified Kitasatospora TaxID=2633591 RepID=UPI0033ADB732